MIFLFKWSLVSVAISNIPTACTGAVVYLAFNSNSALCSVGTVVLLSGKTHLLFTGKDLLLPFAQ